MLSFQLSTRFNLLCLQRDHCAEVPKVAELSRSAEHNGYENLVIYALQNHGPDDWQNRLHMYVRPPIHVSQGDILHFKHLRVLELNRMATRTFIEKINNNNKAESFFSFKF